MMRRGKATVFACMVVLAVGLVSTAFAAVVGYLFKLGVLNTSMSGQTALTSSVAGERS